MAPFFAINWQDLAQQAGAVYSQIVFFLVTDEQEGREEGRIINSW